VTARRQVLAECDRPPGNICNRRRADRHRDRADHRTGDRYASSGNRREERYDIGQGKPAGKALHTGAALVAGTYEVSR
jgi:hypothetical protein